jgi:leucyl aminopeptidase
MYLKHGKKNELGQALVLVGDKKTKLGKLVSKEVKQAYEKFQNSDDPTDFYKTFDQYIFFVKIDGAEKLRNAGSSIRKQLKKDCESISLFGDDTGCLAVAEGIALSNYQFIHYFKDAAKKKNALSHILLADSIEKSKIEYLNNSIKAVFWARDMVNEPVSHLTATQLSVEIEKLAENTSLEVTVLTKTKLEALKMGGLLAVNKGSIEPPTFTVVEYKPKKAINKKPIVLVGKGVVYDTGGLSLKPTPNSMDCMKSDMAGAACVVGAIYGAALNALPLHIIALIPATDNRPGLNAYAPGDIITMFDGTTVEVLNTDAEGRMILADALAYSNKFNPELVIDAATLTGSAVAAIGTNAAIIMGNATDSVFEQLDKAGNVCHERVVRFPFWDEYFEEMKSSIADLKNLGGPTAGMITAGKFLEHFVKSPYVHMDIAGPSWLGADKEYRPKGGTGYGVRLLMNFFEQYK